MKSANGIKALFAIILLGVLSFAYLRGRHNALNEALGEAVIHDDATAVIELIGKGADPNHVTTQEVDWNIKLTQSPLTMALDRASHLNPDAKHPLAVVQQLVNAGAKFDDPGLFRQVVFTHDPATIQLCLSKGLKPNAAALNEAIEYGDPDVVRQILAHIADDPQAKRPDSFSLSKAVTAGSGAGRGKGNSVAIGELLLAEGASFIPAPPSGSPSGFSGGEFVDRIPMSKAASVGNVEFMAMLLKHGADVNIRAEQASTPLHFAVTKPTHVPAVKWLLAHGANVNAKRLDGRTPLDMARLAHSTEIIALLKQAGGKEGTPQ